jgi:hypothetical protein
MMLIDLDTICCKSCVMIESVITIRNCQDLGCFGITSAEIWQSIIQCPKAVKIFVEGYLLNLLAMLRIDVEILDQCHFRGCKISLK